MKNKLHKNNTPCHPERSEGSHSLIRKLPHWLIFSFLFISLSGYSQPYQWDWAINGGGGIGDNGWFYRAEQIRDIVIGSDGNYYFLANMNKSALGMSSQLAGQPVTVYNDYSISSLDIFLFSTTCDGLVR